MLYVMLSGRSGAGGDSESEEEDDDVGDGDVEPYTDDAPAVRLLTCPCFSFRAVFVL